MHVVLSWLPTTTIFDEAGKDGVENLLKWLTFIKAFFSLQWKFLIHTITQCLSAKTTAWNEFSSTMASAIICLATNQKFNLSKYICDAMSRFGKAKDAQAKDIASLKKRVQKLGAGKKKSGTTRLIKLMESDGCPKCLIQDDLQGDEVMWKMVVGEKPEQSEKVQEPSESPEQQHHSTRHHEPVTKTKDKGKAIMIEPEVPLKKKDQVSLDEEMARNLEAQLQAELIKEERLARKKKEEANIALIESWENT
ncbi:hypothetical protein Tco_0834353 [Tanacetum coccineum]